MFNACFASKMSIYKLMKLTTCVFVQDLSKDKLIELISRNSDRYGDKLLEFMDLYHLNNLQSASENQLREYVQTHLTKCKACELGL